MEEDKQRSIIITEGGQQILTETGAGVVVEVYLPDDSTKRTVKLDVTDSEFAQMQEQAVTNDIPADILKDKKAE